MKTQKRFIVSGMLKTFNILGICLILVALFAPTAHAETVFVDPGPVGGTAQDFQFATSDTDFVDIVWTDNKTLEYTSGVMVIRDGDILIVEQQIELRVPSTLQDWEESGIRARLVLQDQGARFVPQGESNTDDPPS